VCSNVALAGVALKREVLYIPLTRCHETLRETTPTLLVQHIRSERRGPVTATGCVTHFSSQIVANVPTASIIKVLGNLAPSTRLLVATVASHEARASPQQAHLRQDTSVDNIKTFAEVARVICLSHGYPQENNKFNISGIKNRGPELAGRGDTYGKVLIHQTWGWVA
jgi:hypothetical protein